jgi:Mrp family chromosome partitioning ATPase
VTKTSASVKTRGEFAALLEASRGSFQPLLARIADDHVPGTGTSVLVVAPRSGSGGSTTAACLAAMLALQSGHSVTLIDGNVYVPTLHRFLDAPMGPGLLDVAEGLVELTHAMRSTSVRNLDLLTAGTRPAPDHGALSSTAIHATIDRALKTTDVGVIDVPAVLEHPDVFSLRGHVTHVVLVIGAGLTTKRDGREAARVLKAAGLEPTGVILNRFRPASFLGFEWPR